MPPSWTGWATIPESLTSARRIGLALALVASATLLGCGGERTPVTHPTAPPGAAGSVSGEAWWLLESAEFPLVAGGLTPPDLASSTGSLWRLEYSDSRQTVQLVADKAGGLFSELAGASPEVGTATVEGVEMTLRQHPGRPQDGIAPSVGAEWVDTDVFISFGGAGLTEETLRALLSRLSRVTKTEWDAAAASVTEEVP